MPYDNYTATNRHAICTALSIWLTALGLVCLPSYGVPGWTTSYLAIVGLAALPPSLAWPWLRRYVVKTAAEPRIAPSRESRLRMLVTVEIAALATVLIYLVGQIPL